MRHRLRIRRDLVMLLKSQIHIATLEAPEDFLDQSKLLRRTSMVNDDLVPPLSPHSSDLDAPKADLRSSRSVHGDYAR